MVRLAFLFGCSAAGIIPQDGPVSMETLMAMNQEPNGVGLEMFLNGNKGAMEHFPMIAAMLGANRKYEEDIDAGPITGQAKDNIDNAFLEAPAPPAARSADVAQFEEEADNAKRAAKLILENPAFAGQKIDPYVLAQAFGADETFLPPPPTNGEFNCRNSCRLQCDYLDGKRKCNFFCGLVC